MADGIVERAPAWSLRGYLPDALLLAADAAIVVEWLRGDLGSVGAVGLHSLVAVAVFAPSLRAGGRLRPAVGCRLIGALLLGPVSAIVTATLAGAALGGRMLPRSAAAALSPTLGNEPPAQDEAETLWLTIREGRRPVEQARLDELATIFETGDLAAQNDAIATISRAYDPRMLPALMGALNARIPAIRVQASAVFAGLRERHVARAAAVMAQDLSFGEETGQLLERAALCRSLAGSGFLDGTAVVTLTARADAISRELARREASASVSPAPAPGTFGDDDAAVPAARGGREAADARTRFDIGSAPAFKRYSCGGTA